MVSCSVEGIIHDPGKGVIIHNKETYNNNNKLAQGQGWSSSNFQEKHTIRSGAERWGLQ